MRTGKKRILGILRGMKQRCYNKNDDRYPRYGGRGITVCDEWRINPQAFYEWSMANGYADDLTIDRIDNDGNYEPSNCRWATQKEQANNKSSCIYITYNGETKDVKQWSEELGMPYNTLFSRISAGWPVEKAFYEPVDTSLRNRYPEVVCEPGENRQNKVREHQRRKAGIRTKEQKAEDDRQKLMAKVELIQNALEEHPGASVRELEKITGIPKSTIHRLIRNNIDILWDVVYNTEKKQKR